jgi:hypothetical protein
MKVRETLRILGGSILVYVVVATCGKAGTSTAVRDGGPVDVSASGGPDVSVSGGFDVSAPGGPDVSVSGGFDVSRVIDVLTNPVPDAQAQSTQSGSRLKSMYYAGADGSKYFLPNQWYDSQRGEKCVFIPGADQVQRCLPPIVIITDYADAGCTQQLVGAYTGAGCTVPNTVSIGTPPIPGSCQSTGYVAYQVGPLFAGTAYSGTPSSCSKAAARGYALYSLGAEVPASSFVSATVQTDQ